MKIHMSIKLLHLISNDVYLHIISKVFPFITIIIATGSVEKIIYEHIFLKIIS